MNPYVYLGYVSLGGLLGCAGIVAGLSLYHWRWMRRWDREHRDCCQPGETMRG